jgi:hypothetical protein
MECMLSVYKACSSGPSTRKGRKGKGRREGKGRERKRK